MENEKKNFKEKYSKNWIFTLKEIKELKKVLLSKTTQEVKFWPDGTWVNEKNNKYSSINDGAVFILTKKDLEYINQDKIDNAIYNICHLIVGLDHPLCDLDIHEYLSQRLDTDLKSFLQEELFKNEYHSYNFVFTFEGLNFECDIDWELSGRYFKVTLDDNTIGISEGIRSIINYLFDLSEEISYENRAITQFCREIRKFEVYYYNSINKCKSQTTTPTELLILQSEVTSIPIMGNYIKLADILNHFQLDLPIPDEADKNKYINFHDLFDSKHDLYGYMDVGDIESYIYWFLENNVFESFDIRED